MEYFDILVVGSGSGTSIVDAALSQGMKVALVEREKLGGTCLNRGCIPSKMIIYPGDIINIIKNAGKFGIKTSIDDIDFTFIMERMRKSVEEDRKHIEIGVKNSPKLKYYHGTGEFIADYTMKVDNEKIQAKNIFLVTGARPEIPSIKNLDKIKYWTSDDIWELQNKPKSLIICGGGFIAIEMAHFFNSVGVDVTNLSRSHRILKNSEPEISETLTQSMRSRMNVITGVEVIEVRDSKDFKEVIAVDNFGKKQVFRAEALLIATGLKSNADLMNPTKTGVQLDENGWIKVNEFFETTKDRIWAFGDAIGKGMFKHVANQEAEVVWHGFSQGHRHAFRFDNIPYAVFSWPEIASVGLTEEAVIKQGKKVLVGQWNYADTAYGLAMGEEDGFVKFVVEEETLKILGCHIIGPHASILIQEVVNCMYCGDETIYPIIDAMHIHPALSEVVQKAAFNL
ncbi:dihydrolipoyl dehydrogenase, partial [Candidatus Bathyarchaeota archaeon]|nr:dihydrolipoyl dehydrogenase [Candidatus Bathyarchaeota archaeon]